METMQHKLKFVKGNAEYTEYRCLQCSRHIIIYYPPNYQKVVFDSGDANASHCGGNGLEIDDFQINEIDPRLEVFEEWINNKYNQDYRDGQDTKS